MQPRYADTSLNNTRESFMVTRAQLDEYIPYIESDYYPVLYLKPKSAVGLLGSSRNSIEGTGFVRGGSSFANEYAPTLPEMKTGMEDHLKMMRLF